MNKKSRKDEEFKRKMALRFLQYCGWDIDKLPVEAWECFKSIDPGIYCIPLIKRDYENGVGIGILKDRYRMSHYQIRTRIKKEVWVGSAAWEYDEK